MLGRAVKAVFVSLGRVRCRDFAAGRRDRFHQPAVPMLNRNCLDDGDAGSSVLKAVVDARPSLELVVIC
jgi:hypothetical protein